MTEEILNKALEEVETEDSADYMAELLMDADYTTWKMFESLASAWLNGNEDFRKGLDDAVMIMTGWSLETISKRLLERR